MSTIEIDSESRDMDQEFTVLESTSSTQGNWTTGSKKRLHKKPAGESTSPKAKQPRKRPQTDTQGTSTLSPPNPPTQNQQTSSPKTPTTSNSAPKPPPIFVRHVSDFKKLCQKLTELVGVTNFKCRARFNDILINSIDSTVYRAIIKYLNDTSADYHCYQLQEDRCFRVVIRNLHHTIPAEDIKTELSERGYQVIRVHNVTHPRTRAPLPLFFIDLKKEEKSKNIFSEQFLQYTRIKVEEPRPRKDLLQCFRCQEYNHSQSYCHHQVRCVKCSGAHDTKSCTKPLSEPAKCSNCGNQHPANYKGCEIYKAVKTLQNRYIKPATSTEKTPPPAASKQPTAGQPRGVKSQQPSTSASPSINPTYASLLHSKYATKPHPQPLLRETNKPLPNTITSPAVTSTPITPSLPQKSQKPPTSLPNQSTPTPDLMSQMQNFFTKLENLITPLLALLTSLISEILPKLLK